MAVNEFLIFHSSDNSPGETVARIRRVATKHAKEKRIPVRVSAVDIDSSNPKKKHRQTRRVIECTTVVDDGARAHAVNPSDNEIKELINDLGR